MADVRIVVASVPNGRVSTWEAWCLGCGRMTMPARRKQVALLVAQRHANEQHDGNAVIAVKNG